MKYKTRVRSRVANLKDSRNPKLRENVLIGLISCEQIAVMTAEVTSSTFLLLLLLLLLLQNSGYIDIFYFA